MNKYLIDFKGNFETKIVRITLKFSLMAALSTSLEKDGVGVILNTLNSFACLI